MGSACSLRNDGAKEDANESDGIKEGDGENAGDDEEDEELGGGDKDMGEDGKGDETNECMCDFVDSSEDGNAAAGLG